MEGMKDDNYTPFICYLTLDDELPKAYHAFDQHLKELGFILIPVKIDQLQTILSSTEQEQVIVLSSITDSKEYKLFNDKVRGFLKFILKSKRLTFMQLSSFSKLNDQKLFAFQKNYYFAKYPLDIKSLSGKLARYYKLKSETNLHWPGGKRSTLNASSV
jgi:hypothetical protein